MTMQCSTQPTPGARVWEIIVGTLSYFVAGSMFIELAATLPLNFLVKGLLAILGPLLLLCAPISVIFTFWASSTSIASKMLTIGKPILLVAALISLSKAMVNIVPLFGGTSWQSTVYVCALVGFLLLFIVAMIIFYVRARE